LEPFCICQVICKEDYDKNHNLISFTCAAHLAEGRAFACRYKSAQERIDAENVPNSYPCSDFRQIQ